MVVGYGFYYKGLILLSPLYGEGQGEGLLNAKMWELFIQIKRPETFRPINFMNE
jgi:hypothetical protein